MPFDTYSALQTAILNRINRASDAEAASNCPDWITLAENEMRIALTKIMVRQGETVANSFSISSEYTALPTGFYRMRTIKLNTNPIIQLEWETPAIMNRRDSSAGAGLPRYCTIEGNSLRVYPTPDMAYTATFSYYALPALSVSNTSNWMLANYPKLYLVAAVAEAAAHYENAEQAQLYELKRDQMLNAIYASDGADQQGVSLRMRTDGRIY